MLENHPTQIFSDLLAGIWILTTLTLLNCAKLVGLQHENPFFIVIFEYIITNKLNDYCAIMFIK